MSGMMSAKISRDVRLNCSATRCTQNGDPCGLWHSSGNCEVAVLSKVAHHRGQICTEFCHHQLYRPRFLSAIKKGTKRYFNPFDPKFCHLSGSGVLQAANLVGRPELDDDNGFLMTNPILSPFLSPILSWRTHHIDRWVMNDRHCRCPRPNTEQPCCFSLLYDLDN